MTKISDIPYDNVKDYIPLFHQFFQHLSNFDHRHFNLIVSNKWEKKFLSLCVEKQVRKLETSISFSYRSINLFYIVESKEKQIKSFIRRKEKETKTEPMEEKNRTNLFFVEKEGKKVNEYFISSKRKAKKWMNIFFEKGRKNWINNLLL